MEGPVSGGKLTSFAIGDQVVCESQRGFVVDVVEPMSGPVRYKVRLYRDAPAVGGGPYTERWVVPSQLRAR
jgi:hypothetical protein